jgi:3-hydroxy-3-methylglutaryl CoA synthase
MQEMLAARDPADPGRSLLESVDLVVPHQANRTMVEKLGKAAGLAPERLYFNIAKVGNTSAASIALAIWDAVTEGVIKRPSRIFTPGFGAGAVAGYAVMRIDPRIIVPEQSGAAAAPPATARGDEGSSIEDMRVAFAG